MAGHSSVEERLGTALQDRGETIAVAESCTGGLIGSKITDVPGSSDYFVGGIISYSNRTKRQRLAVSREAIESHGVVSDPVAREMAQHVRDETDAAWAVSTTGYASPPQETSEFSAGSVYIGVAHAGPRDEDGTFADVEYHEFDGNRRVVKDRIATQALESVLARVDSRG